MTIWVFTLWLVVNGQLQFSEQIDYATEAACVEALANVVMPEETNWIARCAPYEKVTT